LNLSQFKDLKDLKLKADDQDILNLFKEPKESHSTPFISDIEINKDLLKQYNIDKINDIEKFTLSFKAVQQLIQSLNLKNPYITINLQNANEFRPIHKNTAKNSFCYTVC